MMKALATVTTTTLTLVLALAPLGCGGLVGGGESSCGQALDHMAACGITDLPDPGACSPDKQELAEQILSASCAELGERSAFSGAGCGSFWALFKPSCWLGGGGNGGGGNGGGGDPGSGRPLGASCNWDTECGSGKCEYRFNLGRTVCVEVMQKKALGAPCNGSDAAWCPGGTVCHNNRCLGYNGAQCDHNSDCISGVCIGGFWGSCK